MLRFLRAFLLLSLAMLAFETVAHLKGWQFPQHLPGNLQELEEQLQHLPEHLRHLPENLRQLPDHLRMPERQEIQGWLHRAYVAWLEFRVDYIAWAIQKLSSFCILLFMVQSVDRIVQCLACFWIKIRGIKPRVPASGGKPRGTTGRKSADAENGFADGDADGYFPMVLVQMPMCNEKEVYETSISHVCQIDWPRDRLLIQVLDDSDDEVCRMLIKAEVTKWSQRGVNVIYRHRLSRTGYKAGNLKSAMACDYVKDYELPIWVICYIPVLMSLLNILPAPKSFPFVIPYLLFENTMSVTKFNAMVSGLFQLGSSYEWIVTKKAGRTSSASDILALAEADSHAPLPPPAKLVRRVSEGGLQEWSRLREQETAEWANKEEAAAALAAAAPATPKMTRKTKKPNRIFKKELALACLLLTAATRSLLSKQGLHFYFLLFQGVTFLAVGLDLIGEQVS
ncbi:Xyloglucan glycosyltransferase 4 [Zea mays]|uniref:Xyloglucan glycosyltransferase 4 n=1 Tax=Zea mays TaxID=4577 RepID=A0A1D6IXV5_MAIZE|nr:Xyloglucan glycosyltransferase 4 [Zea mays]